MIAFWDQIALPAILSNYELKDVFNADEFGLFFQCLPKKTFHFKDKRCSGGKSSKARLTKMLAASATGVKLPMLVIRKSKNPLYFKNVNCLLCSYKAQKKFWIDSQIFGYGCANVTKVCTEGRTTAVPFKNCPVHPSVSNLTNIQLIFLPPSTTSVL